MALGEPGTEKRLMMIEHASQLIDALILGAAVGAIYFMALWATVRRLIFAGQPVLMSVLGMYARLIATGVALCIIMDDSVFRLAAALTGFMVARAVAVKWAMPADNTSRA